ncbi:O-antigen ligase family protein [Candidatus Uhrbacteria bacterium]|nr:O-antigen ligase family protein [Candidatus Uhrbacteria bacterium]
MASVFNTFFSLAFAALAFLLPLGTVFIVQNAESQYERVLVTATDILLVAVIVFGVLFWIRSRKHDPMLRRIAAILFAFLVFAAISLFAVPELSLIQFAAFFRLALAVCAACFIAIIPSQKNMAFIALVIAGVLQAGYGIVQFATQQIDPIPWLGVASHSPFTLGDAVVQTAQMRFLRAYGSFVHPNILGAFLGVSFFISIFLVRTVQRAASRAALIGSALIITVGVLLTFSRGVWLALAVAVIVSYCIDRWYVRRSPSSPQTKNDSLQIFTIGVLAVCTIFIFFFSDVVASRIGIAGNARLETRSVNERLTSIGDAISIIQSNPFGIGIGNYVPYRMQQDRQAGSLRPHYEYQPIHSHLLLILAEVGIVGFAAIMVFFFAVFFVTRQRVLAAEYQPAFLALIIDIGVFLFVSGLFDHAYWTIPSAIILWWFCIGLLLRSRPC